ncbi:MAG TPA: hypothetical protein PKD53_07475 [Chloroflexaceae bacterium]|nr:hypothetical protein [Chloroflexaceae bacterium]
MGGTIGGNCETGSSGIETAPPSRIRIATTAAKIGRSMKNATKPGGRGGAPGQHILGLRRERPVPGRAEHDPEAYQHEADPDRQQHRQQHTGHHHEHLAEGPAPVADAGAQLLQQQRVDAQVEHGADHDVEHDRHDHVLPEPRRAVDQGQGA